MIDTEYPVIEFTTFDRCDASALSVSGTRKSCNAQAYSAASRDDMPAELLFCLHHIKEYKDTLEDNDWVLTHDTDAIAMLTDKQYIAV